MTRDVIEEILGHITYRDWRFNLEERGGGFLLQVMFNAPCATSGILEEQRCRKWYVSKYACDNEVVRTAYLAVQQAVIHELDENFLFCGQRIHNPHVNYTNIVEGMDRGWISDDVRKKNGSQN